MSEETIILPNSEPKKQEFKPVLSFDFEPESRSFRCQVNTDDEAMMWFAWHKLEESIRYRLFIIEKKREAMAVQTVAKVVPKNILDKIRGK